MILLLLRKALRDVAAMGARALLLVLVIGAGVGMAAGIGLALGDVRATRDAFYHDQALADLDVRLQRPIQASVLAARAQAAGATLAETRLVLDGIASRGAERTAAEVLGMRPHARLDRLAIVQGPGLSQADPLGAVVEAQYAHTSGLRVGDMLGLAIGGRPIQVRVRGIARSPEYLLATADQQYLIPSRARWRSYSCRERGSRTQPAPLAAPTISSWTSPQEPHQARSWPWRPGSRWPT